MGMIFSFISSSDESIKNLFDKPELIHELTKAASTIRLKNMMASAPPEYRAEIADSFAHLLDPNLSTIAADELIFSLDKAWHGIHFLLTQSEYGGDWPKNFLLSGTPIGDIDVGYGPARAYSSMEVTKINECLKQIDHSWLENRFSSKKMIELDIYPNIWAIEEEEALKWLVEYFDQLTSYIKSVNDIKKGIVIWLN